ncbi:hypothetical protein GZH47_01170 [Paenibacillus rhizovicinus]|uniref:Ferric oxidoreductase domain-containing protein n=1 Tax=Paenibacillus rhizovicinus TaxID=2704463 RepID=A0A6C0NTN5_9BACL|nr:hypothetical protein [Paenibacillus rhizovicinus]QHW29580.1 hypothetical protein GZH47_01170 [Paenibacillus rhizovicinus]
MSKSKKVWIPAFIAVVTALILVVIYSNVELSHRGEALHARPHGVDQGALRESTHRPAEGEGRYGGYFSTLGTVALYSGAAGFSWIWFKRKQKSPLIWIRKVGKLLHAMHKSLGWFTLIIIAIHGIYFLFTKIHDNKIYSGLASFTILLALAGYGYFINKVRNKWMRVVHRSLGMIWVPVLFLHAGGSTIIAVVSSLAVGGLVWVFERSAGKDKKPVPGDR